MISTFFDAKVGIRYDSPEGPNRTYGVLGLQGLAPQWFEVDADLFLSNKGKASVRLDVDYDILLTNRLIFRPTAELELAFSQDPEIGVGSGISKTELGLRVSYDLVDRNLAPYAGAHWEKKYGATADFASEEGDKTDEFFFVLGARVLF